MTVLLDGNGGLIKRVERAGQIMDRIHAELGAVSTGEIGNIKAFLNDFDNETVEVLAAIDGLPDAIDSWRSTSETFLQSLSDAMQAVLIAMVHADNQLPELTVEAALEELIRQMGSASESVQSSAPTATVTADAGNDGTGALVASVRDGKGELLENALPEDVLCERDDTLQQFSCRGEAAADSKVGYLYGGQADATGGSGSSTTVPVTNAGAGEGLLTNGGFETFTVADVPDGWELQVGTAGTDGLQEQTTVLRDASAYEFDGDDSTLTELRQDITSSVDARTPLALCLFTKLDVEPAAGVLTIDLHDGSGVISDDAGNANSLAIDLTAESTNWTAQTAFFRVPEPKPASVFLRVRLSTALSAGTSLFLDQCGLVAATQLYASGGPYLAAFAGGVDFTPDDLFTVAIANARGPVQRYFDQFFDTASLNLLLPSSGSPTVPT